jgi:predicted DNA-binding transcriptional regulator AlpA
MYQKIKNDPQKKLQPINKKGVSCATQYKNLTPKTFPPSLHMEVGMVNQAWEDVIKWIDDVVKKIP